MEVKEKYETSHGFWGFWKKAYQASPVTIWYVLSQFVFLIFHIAIGTTIRAQPSGDGPFYLSISRNIASLYIDDVSMMAGFSADDILGSQPNFLYPLLISPFHFFHEYIYVRAGIVVFNSVFICVGVHFLFKLFNLVSSHKPIVGLFAVIISGHLMPYSSFTGLIMTEPIYYCSFYAFCFLTTKAIKNTVFKKQIIVKSIVGLASACVLFFYVKQTFVLLPVIVVVAIIMITFGFKLEWLFSLKILFWFLFSYISLLWFTQQLAPVTGIGRYSGDVSIYNFNQPLNIMLTYAGSLLNLFSYTLFLPFFVVFIVLKQLFIRGQKRENSEYITLGIILILMTAAMPLVLSLHSVSHIEWAYPDKNYYIFHERLYGYLIAPFFLMVIANPRISEKIFSYLASIRLTAEGIALVVIYVLLQTHDLEPYAEILAVINFSLEKHLDINNHYALFIPVFLYVCLCLLFNLLKDNKEIVKRSIYCVVIALLFISIKTSNYLYVEKVNGGQYLNPKLINMDTTIYIDKNNKPPLSFQLMLDNRIKFKVISQDELAEKAKNGDTKYFFATRYDSYKRKLYDYDFPLGLSEAESFSWLNTQVLLLPHKKRYFAVKEYAQNRNTREFHELRLIEGVKRLSSSEHYPWIRKEKDNHFVLHPGNEKDAVLDFKWIGSEDLIVQFVLDVNLTFLGKNSDGVILTIKKDDAPVGEFKVDETNRTLRKFDLRVSKNEHIFFIIKKNNNSFYDEVHLRIYAS